MLENYILGFSQYRLTNFFYLQCLITLIYSLKQHEIIYLGRENTELHWLFFIGLNSDLLQIYSPYKEVHITSFMSELSLVSVPGLLLECRLQKVEQSFKHTCINISSNTLWVHIHIYSKHGAVSSSEVIWPFRKNGQFSRKPRNLASYGECRHLVAFLLLNSGITNQAIEGSKHSFKMLFLLLCLI